MSTKDSGISLEVGDAWLVGGKADGREDPICVDPDDWISIRAQFVRGRDGVAGKGESKSPDTDLLERIKGVESPVQLRKRRSSRAR
jgi:hypothetical protein